MVKDRHRTIAAGKKSTDIKPTGKKVEPKRREAAEDNCMRTLRAVLNYAFEDEKAGTQYVNPVNVLSSRKRKAWFKVDRRRTLIKNSELPAWHKAVMALDNPVARDYFLFLLNTGLRRNEAATLQWRQVDFDESCFTIAYTKNKQPHTLPLSDYLINLLDNRKKGLKVELNEAKAALALPSSDSLSPKERQAIHNRLALAESRLASPFVFPGEGKTGHIVEPKRAIDGIIAVTGIHFSCHDLRSTFSTIAESLDLSPLLSKLFLITICEGMM
jgi:integrase